MAAEVASREFVCLAFSPDSKGLLTHGGAPDWTLVYWLWEKAKVGAVSKAGGVQARRAERVARERRRRDGDSHVVHCPRP